MRKRLENILFVKHPMAGVFGIMLLFGIPWWIAYWPGTLQYDSCGQLLQYYGVGKMTGHHPLPVTMVMGVLMDAGRVIVDSDNAGLFLYTGIQFLTQCAVVAYVFSVYERSRVPMWIRWGSLAFYAVFPLVENWGISYVKDSGYYISFLLFTLLLVDLFREKEACGCLRQKILLCLAMVGVVAFRNDGRYIILMTTIVLLFCRRKRWRDFLPGVGIALLFLVLVEGVYMPLRHIPSGSIREALSVPLMQSANYLQKYRNEITAEEEAVLLDAFEVQDLREVAEAYDTEISDDVKALFQEYPSKETLKAYFNVWFAQLRKHPEVYIETFWKHCNGYFVPWKNCYEDVIGWFKILDGQSRTDEYLDIHFGIENPWFRDKMEAWAYLFYKIPVVRMLYHTGTYTWVMFACAVVMLLRKRKSELFIIVPGIIVLLICMVSPLNAGVRYYLPVMVTTPVYIALATAGTDKGKEKDEKTSS